MQKIKVGGGGRAKRALGGEIESTHGMIGRVHFEEVRACEVGPSVEERGLMCHNTYLDAQAAVVRSRGDQR